MIEVREIDHYSDWFQALRDMQARARILARLKNVSLGTMGDVGPVGEGVSELRIHYGPGYRVYFVKRGSTVIILLGGGDKSSQKEDIAKAKALAKKLKE
ncbi:type II toxin-antitoxin system RelE/ParE family toxin [Mesorhizobium sp. M7A.F.Ca.US.011.01.1.1]|uniref:type II toxin-antitoxin system RelE/ParE family toxin n=1 Tax=Mesorhizobium sp. M7A.F.Ca.US.011.01.1.1 TaxID=2496741 RepID=UPI000FCB0687|nr:type II toxin-antitoxin system RelE/ParE family toxin [Mesorhizobium sp. M7A.F.Ca.US.011.01.1.1]RUX23783.1 type II toxin-antitoxin system RelE/ParE family toxin [Mesorhizobium sp. M7A.F.Ca.US.011.01.1.1]